MKRILERIDALRERDAFVLIGIDGLGGAGKSTFAGVLRDEVGKKYQACVVHTDDFYKLSRDRRGVTPREFGGLWDLRRLDDELLRPLARRRVAAYRRYDWEDDRLAEKHEIHPAGVAIVEGCYSTISLVRHFYDLTIWVTAPRGVRLRRGIERDGEDSRDVWEKVWMAAEDNYVHEQRPHESADFLVDSTGNAPSYSVTVRESGGTTVRYRAPDN